MIDAVGALRARVKLQNPTRIADELGGAAILWTDAGDIWAEIEARNASEQVAGDMAFPVADFRVTMRRRDDVRHGWRVLWGERRLRVLGREDDGASRIVLLCQEEAP